MRETLAAFYAEHRFCGEMDAGVEDERFGYLVWMWCLTCEAKLDLSIDGRDIGSGEDS